jgi:hypothetical protein
MNNDPKDWTPLDRIIETIVTAVGLGIALYFSRLYGPTVGDWLRDLAGSLL